MFRYVHLLIVFLLLPGTLLAAESPLAREMAAVEKIRGLKFKHEVVVKTIDRKEIPDRLRAEMKRQMPYPVDDYIAILRALQLVDGKTSDLTDKLLALYEEQVLAYYDPTKHIYFDISQLPDAAKQMGNADLLKKSVAIHELTHALQDQYFDIGKRDDALRDDWDGQLAYHSVIEGEASLVMIGWMLDQAGQPLETVIGNDSLTNAMTEGAAADKTMDSTAPRYFVESLKFPYLDGLRFVIAAYKRGGWKELDRVNTNPPRTTREILHPDEYFARTFTPHPFNGVEPPDTLTVEHLGEFHWSFLVGADHVHGWVDDHVTVTCADEVVADTTWDTQDHASNFRDAYLAFLGDHGVKATSTIDGTSVRVTYGVPR